MNPDRNTRRGTVLTGVLAAALVAAGCAAIPTSSRIEVVGPQATDSAETPAPAPPEGLDPLITVRKFIEVSANQAGRHAAARAYLAAEAKNTWNDTAPIVVLDDQFSTAPATDADPDNHRQVHVRGLQLGQVGEDGAFVANRATVTLPIGLVRQNGQWRIDQLPAGLLIRSSDFTSNYTAVGIRFIDPVRGTLVTDQRWIPTRPQVSLPSRTMDLLLGGPSAAVKDAVVSRLDGATTRTNVALADDDVLHVDLTGVPELSDTQRRQAAAQVAASLDKVGVRKVRILVDGSALVPNREEWTPADALPFEPDSVEPVKPDAPDLAVDHGRIVRIQGGTAVDGPAGTGELAVESAAQSPNGELFALVSTAAGAPLLYMGPLGSLQPVPVQASRMTRPTWRTGTVPEAWTVINGNDGVGVLRTDAGQLVPFSVDLSELSAKGNITELRLSRDGVRVAAIVDGSLYVAIVVDAGLNTKVRNTRLLVAPGAPQLSDVDWKDDKVVVATVGRDNPAVFEASVDGQAWAAYQPTNLTGPITGVAAATGRRVYVSDASGIWSAADPKDLWYSRGFSAGTDPFYPG